MQRSRARSETRMWLESPILKLTRQTDLSANMEAAQKWYIVKMSEGTCQILPSQQVENKEDPNIVERWGPFQTPDEAIARRVGLIRAGKCQPQ